MEESSDAYRSQRTSGMADHHPKQEEAVRILPQHLQRELWPC